MTKITVHYTQGRYDDDKFVERRSKERAGFPRGVEVEATFVGQTPLDGFAMARKAAQIYCGLLTAGGQQTTVPFVSDLGPYAGRVMGSQSADGKQGWRIDWSKRTGDFHINWWDRRVDPTGKDRSKQYYGANFIVGGTQDLFWQIEAHFPGQVKRT